MVLLTQPLKKSLSREYIGYSFIRFPSGYQPYPGLGAGDPQRTPALTVHRLPETHAMSHLQQCSVQVKHTSFHTTDSPT